MRLWQIDTGFACAGLALDHMKCVECAPILYKWCLGRTSGTIKQLCRNKGWKLTEIQ
jgi:hypothetical protein